jgi:predicted membrane-bound spermidine synthase
MHGHPAKSWLIPCYLLSGACGLCFEILWARQLQVVLGATSKAVTTVVSIFMVGLALGNTLGARWAVRVRRPALAFGASEIAVGLSALAVTSLLPLLEILKSLGLRYFLAILALLLPSTLMGLTFPFVSEAWDPKARGGSGMLYAANTTGAALGCLAAGFFGIGLLGIRGTAEIVALGNLVCGTTVYLLFRRSAEDNPTLDERVQTETAIATHQATVARIAILGAAGLAGASALACEILWTRALLPYLNSSSYTFAAILATYLAGIALGSVWVAPRCAQLGTRSLAILFGVLQLLLCVLVALSPRLMSMVEGWVSTYVGIRQLHTFSGWASMVATVLGRTAVVVWPSTFIMGASLPMCIALLGRTGRAGGQVAGLVSAINTLGAVLGSVLAGFLLLPSLGSSHSLLVVGIGNLTAASIVLVGIAKIRWQYLTLALVGSIVCIVVVQPREQSPFLGRLAAGARVLMVDEGPQDTTTVIERQGSLGPERLILSNGVSYAGDAPPAQRYMALLAHLPALFARDIRQGMVICVGTGTTAGNLALYQELKTLDLVDISPAVHRTLPLFASVNYAVWTDPRVRIHEADGRQFMTRSLGGYGVITLEPPPPRAAGAASLYTLGLYQRARDVLMPGGVIAQWLPLHGMTEIEILMLGRTFQQVFPNTALFILNPDEAALLGSIEPLVFDVDRVTRRLADKRIQSALARIGFTSSDSASLATELLALAVVHGPALRQLLGEGPIITDDHPLIEQFAILLTPQAQKQFDPDGRRGLLHRITATNENTPSLSIRGPMLPGLHAARSLIRTQINGWLQKNQSNPP